MQFKDYKVEKKAFITESDVHRKANVIGEIKTNSVRNKTKILVKRTIILDKDDFNMFAINLLNDFDFITENKDFYKDPIDHVIDPKGVLNIGNINDYESFMLVTAEEYDYGILVDPQGYDYARYTAYYEKKETVHKHLLKIGYKEIMTFDDDLIKYEIQEDIYVHTIVIYKSFKAWASYKNIVFQKPEIIINSKDFTELMLKYMEELE